MVSRHVCLILQTKQISPHKTKTLDLILQNKHKNRFAIFLLSSFFFIFFLCFFILLYTLPLSMCVCVSVLDLHISSSTSLAAQPARLPKVFGISFVELADSFAVSHSLPFLFFLLSFPSGNNALGQNQTRAEPG